MNRSGRKGWAGEAPVIAYLLSKGFHRVHRLRQQGNVDKGDIGGIDGVCIEVKNQARYDFPKWMRETYVEKANAKASLGALVVKPNRMGLTNIDNWWVILTLEDFTALITAAGYGPRQGDES